MLYTVPDRLIGMTQISDVRSPSREACTAVATAFQPSTAIEYRIGLSQNRPPPSSITGYHCFLFQRYIHDIHLSDS